MKLLSATRLAVGMVLGLMLGPSARAVTGTKKVRDMPQPMTYLHAIKSGKAFTDPELKSATPYMGKDGRPAYAPGGAAFVFKMKNKAGQDLAVRVFLEDEPTRDRRYKAISKFIDSHPDLGIVPVRYLPEGITINKEKYPVTVMPWVEGELLDEAIQNKIVKEDVRGLETLAKKWRAQVKKLDEAGVAHGDLQEGNIKITPNGEIALIDHDSMYVPELAGLTSIGTGFQSYQHLDRGNRFDDTIDRFSAHVIHTSLIALAENPDLWQFHEDKRLILGLKDYDNPHKSRVVNEMVKDEGPVQDATLRLLDYWQLKDIGQIPTLEEALGGTISKKVLRSPHQVTSNTETKRLTSHASTKAKPGGKTVEIATSGGEMPDLSVRPIDGGGEPVHSMVGEDGTVALFHARARDNANIPSIGDFVAFQRPGGEIVLADPIKLMKNTITNEIRYTRGGDLVIDSDPYILDAKAWAPDRRAVDRLYAPKALDSLGKGDTVVMSYLLDGTTSAHYPPVVFDIVPVNPEWAGRVLNFLNLDSANTLWKIRDFPALLHSYAQLPEQDYQR